MHCVGPGIRNFFILQPFGPTTVPLTNPSVLPHNIAKRCDSNQKNFKSAAVQSKSLRLPENRKSTVKFPETSVFRQ